MKKAFLLVLFSVFLITVKAQQAKLTLTKFTFAGGINVGLPIGDFGDIHTFGIGAELQPEYRINNFSAVYGSLGYTQFFGKKFNFEEPESLSSGLLPVLIGAKVYLSPQFFVGAKAGLGFITGWGSGAGLDYQPQIGLNNKNFQVNFSYNGLSDDGVTISSLLLSVLYKF